MGQSWEYSRLDETEAVSCHEKSIDNKYQTTLPTVLGLEIQWLEKYALCLQGHQSHTEVSQKQKIAVEKCNLVSATREEDKLGGHPF